MPSAMAFVPNNLSANPINYVGWSQIETKGYEKSRMKSQIKKRLRFITAAGIATALVLSLAFAPVKADW